EKKEYEQFRQQYLALWRGYFDPVGMRISFREKQVRLDTFILPLIQTSAYRQLRERTGSGTTTFNLGDLSPSTILQLMAHISPDAPERREVANLLVSLNGLGKHWALDWLGDWITVRLDDSPVYEKLAELWIRRQMEPQSRSYQQELRLLCELP